MSSAYLAKRRFQRSAAGPDPRGPEKFAYVQTVPKRWRTVLHSGQNCDCPAPKSFKVAMCDFGRNRYLHLVAEDYPDGGEKVVNLLTASPKLWRLRNSFKPDPETAGRLLQWVEGIEWENGKVSRKQVLDELKGSGRF